MRKQFYIKVLVFISFILLITGIKANAQGHWTEGYWDDANQVWVEGYWTENTPVGYWVEGYWDEATQTWHEGYWVETETSINVTSSNYLKIGDYSANLYWDGYQDIVDAPDSATIWSYGYGTKTVIGDHAHQGFNVISNLESGATAQYWCGGVESTISMVSKYNGVNTGYQLMINGKDIEEYSDGWLVMYTCNDWSGENVTITFWN